jgi:hypothetical protein
LTELIGEFLTVVFQMKQHLLREVLNFNRACFSNNYEPNCIYKVIKGIFISANFLLLFISKFLSLRLQSRSIYIKIYRTIIRMPLLFHAD